MKPDAGSDDVEFEPQDWTSVEDQIAVEAVAAEMNPAAAQATLDHIAEAIRSGSHEVDIETLAERLGVEPAKLTTQVGTVMAAVGRMAEAHLRDQGVASYADFWESMGKLDRPGLAKAVEQAARFQTGRPFEALIPAYRDHLKSRLDAHQAAVKARSDREMVDYKGQRMSRARADWYEAYDRAARMEDVPPWPSF